MGEGFDYGIRVGYLSDSDLVVRKIGSLGVRLMQGPAYVLEKGDPEHPGDMLKHSAITPGTDSWTFTKGGQSVTLRPQGRFKADSAHVLVEAAGAGIDIVAIEESLLPVPTSRLGHWCRS